MRPRVFVFFFAFSFKIMNKTNPLSIHHFKIYFTCQPVSPPSSLSIISLHFPCIPSPLLSFFVSIQMLQGFPWALESMPYQLEAGPSSSALHQG